MSDEAAARAGVEESIGRRRARDGRGAAAGQARRNPGRNLAADSRRAGGAGEEEKSALRAPADGFSRLIEGAEMGAASRLV